MRTETMQVQRENLEKENDSLKADLEQMHGLQEQYEQLQEKVLKFSLYVCYMHVSDRLGNALKLPLFQERAATENINSLTHRLEQKTAK